MVSQTDRTYTYTHLQQSHASVGLAQARPNKTAWGMSSLKTSSSKMITLMVGPDFTSKFITRMLIFSYTRVDGGMKDHRFIPISSNPILSNPISSNKIDTCPISSKI